MTGDSGRLHVAIGGRTARKPGAGASSHQKSHDPLARRDPRSVVWQSRPLPSTAVNLAGLYL